MKIVVLGAGITGLSLAWFLRKRYGREAQITLIEKSPTIGGWIQSTSNHGFLFEQGPRSCRPYGKGITTLELIEELGLEDQILFPSLSSTERYLFINKKLFKLPRKLFSFLFEPKLWGFFPSLIKEIFTKPNKNGTEETIHQFFERHFGTQISNLFIDPFISGIFAGDINKLSLKSCFPSLYEQDREWGSLIKAALFSKKQDLFNEKFLHLQKAKLFSLKGGLNTLINQLGQEFQKDIHLKTSVDSLNFQKEKIEISFNELKIEADYLFSTIPAYSLAQLLHTHDNSLSETLDSMTFSSLAVVNCGFKQKVLNYQGFGYLIPSLEKEKILGVSWDSEIFPQNNHTADETRLTVMIGGAKMHKFSDCSKDNFIEIALEALERHLKIKTKPDAIQCYIAKNAIPQYLVGHQEKVLLIEDAIQKLSPRFRVLGNSFYGISVNDCIAKAKEIAFLHQGQ